MVQAYPEQVCNFHTDREKVGLSSNNPISIYLPPLV